MSQWVMVLATLLQGLAMVYGVLLIGARRGGGKAWLFLLAAMSSMLAWRVVVMTGLQPTAAFNAAIGLWGSTTMLAAMMFFSREIAHRERAEAERDHLFAKERDARTDAERAGRVKDEFLATLSHELRTPLTSILGWCSILRGTYAGQADLPRALATIQRNAEAQARLVDDLLDAVRIQAGTLHLDVAPVNLQVPVSAALDAARPAAEAKRVAVELHAPAEPVIVNGDPGRLQQMASNLLVNAIKFTPPGGTVSVSIGTTLTRARLVVSDTGVGLEPAFMPHVFARFRQADSTVSRRHGGLGLGLSIVMSLAKLHGGDVEAASDGAGTGATFTVTLPIATDSVADEAIRGGVAAAAQLAPDALAGTRILVVEDDADVRGVVARLLEKVGAAVAVLPSGEALTNELQEFRPHLLLIDIGLPGEDGYSLVRRIRRMPPDEGGAIPAVSLTAHARSEDRARAIESGFQEYLTKPVDAARLIATISRLVKSAATKPA